MEKVYQPCFEDIIVIVNQEVVTYKDLLEENFVKNKKINVLLYVKVNIKVVFTRL